MIGVAVDALAYYVNAHRSPLPIEAITRLDIEWLIERHPCDGQPYMAGMSVVAYT